MADPGSITAVIRDAAVVEMVIDGVANADTGAPLTRDAVFYVGSIAKQFVAACVRSLVDEGSLDVETPVGRLVSDLPAWGADVRVRHLIHHTSGLTDRDYSAFPGVPPTGVPARGNDDTLAEIRAVGELTSPVGTAYRYANRGYHLLAHGVSGVAGRSVADLARDRLFAPLGMRATFFRDAPTPLPPSAARGHFEAVDGQTHVEPAAFHAIGAGGLWTTVDDLVRWDATFYEKGSLQQRLTHRGSLDDGTPIHYAWGLSVRTHRGLPIQSHGGSFLGWNAKMVRFPTERTTVIVLANSERLDVSSHAFETADRVLASAIDRTAPHADETFGVG